MRWSCPPLCFTMRMPATPALRCSSVGSSISPVSQNLTTSLVCQPVSACNSSASRYGGPRCASAFVTLSLGSALSLVAGRRRSAQNSRIVFCASTQTVEQNRRQPQTRILTEYRGSGPPRNRTGTPRRAADFESAASANSARGPTPAAIASRGRPDHSRASDATSLRSVAGENWGAGKDFRRSSDATRCRAASLSDDLSPGGHTAWRLLAEAGRAGGLCPPQP